MTTIRNAFEGLFADAATKRVTRTDKSKGAFVLTNAQVTVLQRAGLELVATDPKPITYVVVLGEPGGPLEASYYYSARSEEAKRSPEPRMGRQFIAWIEEDDEVTLATDGERLFAFRNKSLEVPDALVLPIQAEAAKKVSSDQLWRIAPSSNAPPPVQTVQRKEYKRSAAVVELVLRRANGRCEFPGCDRLLFKKLDNTSYLEVHHIKWLRHGGTDSVDNAAALCPHCHRAQHHDANLRQLGVQLTEAIGLKHAPRD